MGAVGEHGDMCGRTSTSWEVGMRGLGLLVGAVLGMSGFQDGLISSVAVVGSIEEKYLLTFLSTTLQSGIHPISRQGFYLIDDN